MTIFMERMKVIGREFGKGYVIMLSPFQLLSYLGRNNKFSEIIREIISLVE